MVANVIEEEIKYEMQIMLDEMTGEQIEQEFPVEYDVVIRRVKKANKVCIEAIPPEEVLIARDARDIKSSSYVAHRMMKTVSETSIWRIPGVPMNVPRCGELPIWCPISGGWNS